MKSWTGLDFLTQKIRLQQQASHATHIISHIISSHILAVYITSHHVKCYTPAATVYSILFPNFVCTI
jgi:hypothetical protein